MVPALGPAIVNGRLLPPPTDYATSSAAYLAWVLSAPQSRLQIMRLARGSTRARLNTEGHATGSRFPSPTVDEQVDIVAQYLDEQTAKIDSLIAETERFIELARERRSALITAAVTGQIDVRAVA